MDTMAYFHHSHQNLAGPRKFLYQKLLMLPRTHNIHYLEEPFPRMPVSDAAAPALPQFAGISYADQHTAEAPTAADTVHTNLWPKQMFPLPFHTLFLLDQTAHITESGCFQDW